MVVIGITFQSQGYIRFNDKLFENNNNFLKLPNHTKNRKNTEGHQLWKNNYTIT